MTEAAAAEGDEAGVVRGLALAGSAHALFAMQDAIVVWLVNHHGIFQILFIRSSVIMLVCAAIGRRPAIERALRSPAKSRHFLRAAIILTAWICYYTAARKLHLAELTTLYYASPVIVTVLGITVLGERVGPLRWLAVAIGFAGVVVAADPGHTPDLTPALLVLVAASLWAWSSILVRQILRGEPTMAQMIISNGLFAIACGLSLPWTWVPPTGFALALMLATGLMSGIGQFCIFEGYRLAPASAIAPITYTSLVWAFILGYLVFGDWPKLAVFLGAGLIAVSAVFAVWSARRGA